MSELGALSELSESDTEYEVASDSDSPMDLVNAGGQCELQSVDCSSSDSDHPVRLEGSKDLPMPAEDSDSDARCVGVKLAADSADASPSARGWKPGENVGEWLGRAEREQPQAQVLICNTLLTIKRLPGAVLRAVAQALSVAAGSCGSLALRVAGAMLGISASRAWRVSKAVERAGWAPVQHMPRDGHEPSGHEPSEPLVRDEKQVLHQLVRAALSCRGQGYQEYTRSVCRLAAAGIDVGDKYHTRSFAKEAEFLAARCLQHHDSLDLAAKIPGLGIRSNLALLVDGVPVGGMRAFGRRGSVLVVCVNAVSPHTHRLQTRLLTWCFQSAGHGGAASSQDILRAVGKAPISMGSRELKRILSLVGGDGAVAQGGPDRPNPGTRTAELLWHAVYGPTAGFDPGELPKDADDIPLMELTDQRGRGDSDAWLRDETRLHCATEWDKFHREDLAISRAIESCQLAGELYTVCSMVDHWFNLAEGRLLLQASAEQIGARL